MRKSRFGAGFVAGSCVALAGTAAHWFITPDRTGASVTQVYSTIVFGCLYGAIAVILLVREAWMQRTVGATSVDQQ